MIISLPICMLTWLFCLEIFLDTTTPSSMQRQQELLTTYALLCSLRNHCKSLPRARLAIRTLYLRVLLPLFQE